MTKQDNVLFKLQLLKIYLFNLKINKSKLTANAKSFTNYV